MRKNYLRCIVSLIVMLLTTTSWAQKRVEWGDTNYGYSWFLLDEAKGYATITYKLNAAEDGPEEGYYNGYIHAVDGMRDDIDKYWSVKAIGDHAYWYAPYMTGLEIYSGIRTVGDQIFNNTGVTEMVIREGEWDYDLQAYLPLTLTYNAETGKNSFSGAPLASLVLSRNLSVPAGCKVFDGVTTLTKVRLNERVTELPAGMFANCTGLQVIRLQNTTPVACDASVFEGVDKSNVSVLVPKYTFETYKAHPVWGQFTKMREMTAEEQYEFTVYDKGNLYDDAWPDFYAYNAEGVKIWYSYDAYQAGKVRVTSVAGQPTGSKWVYHYPYYEKRLVIPQTVTNPYGETFTVSGVQAWAFEADPYLEEVILPETIDTIGLQAFSSCEKLKHLELPNNVSYLGQNCFAESGLTGEFVVPAGVTVIESATFRNTTISKLTFGEGSRLDSISDQAIFFMFDLEELELPTGLRTIAYAGISSCSRLRKANLPEGLVKVEPYVLTGCPIEELVIPSTLVEIGEGFLSTGHQISGDGSSSLCRISVAAGNPVYDSREDCNAVIHTATNTLYMGKAISKLPSTLEAIAVYSYSDPCMKTLTLPASIKKIEGYAFADGMMMRGATFSKIISSIEEPAGVLEPDAFIKMNDMWEDSDETYKQATLYVPAGTKSKYEADAEWGRFLNIVEETPVTVDDAKPMIAETTTSFTGSAELNEHTDLSAAVIGNLFITLSTHNDDATINDVYDAEEKALVINSTVANESKIDFIESRNAATDAVMNNFNGILFEVPAGTGLVTVDCKTTGNRMLGVKVGNQAASTFKQDDKGAIEVAYDTKVATHIYIYSVEELQEEVATARAQAKAYATAKMLKKDVGLKNMKNVAAFKGPEDTQPEMSQTLIYGVGWKPNGTGALVMGDVNGDGKVDVSDYIGVANHILGQTPEGFNEQAADVNGDGKIDVSDYIGVANIILTGSI